MSIFIDYILIPIVILISLYLVYRLLIAMADREAKKYFETEKQKLLTFEEELKKRERQIEKSKNDYSDDLSKKKSEAIAEYQKALEGIKIAENMKQVAQNKIEKRDELIRDLRLQLHNARKKSERFAKKLTSGV